MAKLKLNDLPQDEDVSKDEMKKARGGAAYIKFDGVDSQGLSLVKQMDKASPKLAQSISGNHAGEIDVAGSEQIIDIPG